MSCEEAARCRAVVPNLGSMDPLVVHRRYQGSTGFEIITVNRRGSTEYRKIDIGGPQSKRLKTAGVETG